jgi:hypothetical protein
MPQKKQIDVSRASFTEKPAPRKQRCTCGCGEFVDEGQMVWTRPFVQKGKESGETRLIDLAEHYHGWLENVTHGYAKRIAKHSREFRDYLER